VNLVVLVKEALKEKEEIQVEQEVLAQLAHQDKKV